MNRPAFLTGSRVYGTPREDSDLDLVVYMPGTAEDKLLEAVADKFGQLKDTTYHDAVPNVPYTFGKLNLIVCVSVERYESFFRARTRCLQEAPVTRERAIEIHKEERAREKTEVPF